MDISVVIPMYGCRKAIPELYQRLSTVLQKLTSEYEIIMVNDSCPQNSWEEIEQLCKQDARVVGIEMARNFGQMKAITAGMDYSTGKLVVVMDCDLQDAPEEIPRLYAKLQEGYDVVFARRTQRKDPPLRRMVSKCFYKIYSIATDGRYDPALANFSIMTRQVADAYCSMREIHRAFVMYVKWLGFRHGYIEVEHQARHSGKSSYSLKKRIRMAEEILTSQSDKLVRLIAKLGLFISLLSFLMIIVTVVRYYLFRIPQGYTSTVAVIFLMGGLILSAIGIVGIYIGNIFMEVKGRPLYVVRTVLNNHNTQKGRVEQKQSACAPALME